MNEPTVTEKHIIDVKSHQQQYLWSCGPSALRTVIYYSYGVDITDNELSILCGSNEDGTNELNFERGLRLLGFKFKQSNSGSLGKLKAWLLKGYLPIVHLVMSDGVGHYMVFVGYDVDNVYLSDPAKGKVISYGISYFLGIWKEEELETQTRWYIVIVGKSKDKISNYIKKLKRIQIKINSFRS